MKMVKKGGVQMKCWDIGGQAQYRSEWGRYTRGCDVIIYVVDANAVLSALILPFLRHLFCFFSLTI